jgi:hypothetical protein
MAIDGRPRIVFRPRGDGGTSRDDGWNYSLGLLAAITVTGMSR